MIHIVAFFRTEIWYFGVKITWRGQIFTQQTPQLGIKAIKPPLSVFPTCQLSISWGLLVYRSFIFRRAAPPPPSSCPRIWQLYRKAGFLSNWCTFTFTHSAIPQVKGKSGHRKKKNKKNTASPSAQSCSSLLRLETYCGRCKTIFLPPSHTLCVLQCVPKNYGGIHFF